MTSCSWFQQFLWERDLYPKLASHSALTIRISQPEGKHPLAFVYYVSGSAWMFIIFLFHFRKLSVRGSCTKMFNVQSLYSDLALLLCLIFFFFFGLLKIRKLSRDTEIAGELQFVYIAGTTVFYYRDFNLAEGELYQLATSSEQKQKEYCSDCCAVLVFPRFKVECGCSSVLCLSGV